MSDATTLLFANDAFYVAFAAGDLAAMDDLWSRRAPVTCLHPGWTPLFGRPAVLKSWRAILESGSLPKVRCENASAHIMGDVGYVICNETMPEGRLVATNLFHREDGRWRLVVHHAGPTSGPAEAPAAPAPAALQ
ncbi:MAG: nuclear transport factor 2 family protein [Rhodobacterales bacterium]|nr:nuclear transport factor 2 family protein [Rhodobacterales bacterium]